ncbi:MAG: hypothetical protein U5O16_36240 [Rhodococcus sp. (in: high G+C Gram-positive bacteria)]|uniref:hypothetical protein n=1 Tax=Rhodococcus sp. TaxID=1831 RepID=UPI002AD67423|nr:hypothetical protein [Rhodococcus sp. (in: high G+C Gram-positive bacteria)]
MYYFGVAVDASKREVRIAGIDEDALDAKPLLRSLVYGDIDLPSALRDLHAAVASTLLALPAHAVVVRRMDPSPRSTLRTATYDRLLAEGAILAAARESVADVLHLSGAEIGKRVGLSKDEANARAKLLLGSHNAPMKWAEATMAASCIAGAN